MKNYQSIIKERIVPAGIQLSDEKNSDLIIVDKRFYGCVMQEAFLGLGEADMEGWWDSPLLDNFIYKLLNADVENRIRNNISLAP